MGTLSEQQELILDQWITSLFYGAYTLIFAASVYILVLKETRSSLNSRLLWITITLFAISTTQNVIYFVQAFISTTIEANSYYAGETESALRAKEMLDLLISFLTFSAQQAILSRMGC